MQPLSPYAVAAVAPAGIGTVAVTVSGASDTSATGESDHYTYAAPVMSEDSPVIDSVTPKSGVVSGGTTVTIKGNHLEGAFAVEFGGTDAARVTPISGSEVEAVAPAAAFPVRVDVTVTTPSGSSAPTLADSFVYGSPPPPIATSLALTPSPNPVAAAQAVGLTAAVAPTDGGGTVAFYADGSSQPISGCEAQTLSQAGAGYQATCSTTGLAAGSHTLSAAYSGDPSYAASSGSASLSISSPPESTGSGSTTDSSGNPHTQTGTSTKAASSTAGSVSLARSTITVQGSGAAGIKLTCTGTDTCSGKLTLTTKRTTKKSKKKHTKTQTIGTTTYSISAGETATVSRAQRDRACAPKRRPRASQRHAHDPQVLPFSCRDTDRKRPFALQKAIKRRRGKN